MGVLDSAPVGGLTEELGGARRPLVLRNGEIERFEEAHGSLWAAFRSFLSPGREPSVKATRDVIALGLIGAGMAEDEARAIIEDLGPSHNPRLFAVAHALVGVTFYPDAAAAIEDDDAAPDASDEKKNDLTDTTSNA